LRASRLGYKQSDEEMNMAQHEQEQPAERLPAGASPIPHETGPARPGEQDHAPDFAPEARPGAEPEPIIGEAEGVVVPFPAAKPRRGGGLGRLFAGVAALALLVAAGGYAAIRFQDQDERLKAIALRIEAALNAAQGALSGGARPTPQKSAAAHKGLVEPPARIVAAPIGEPPALDAAPEPNAPDAAAPIARAPQASVDEAPPAPKAAEAAAEPEPPIVLEAPETLELTPPPKPAAKTLAATTPAAEPAAAPEPPRAEAPAPAAEAPPPRTEQPKAEPPAAASVSESAALTARVEKLEALTQRLGALAEEALAAAKDAVARPQKESGADPAAAERQNALESRLGALAEDMRQLREKLDSPKAETRVDPEEASPERANAGEAAAAVVAAEALQRELERGRPFVAEQTALASLGADPALLALLAPSASAGAPTAAQLLQSFVPLESRLRAFDAPKIRANTFWDAVWQYLLSLVRVRSADAPASETETVSDIVAKIDHGLRRDDALAAAEAFERLPDLAKAEAGGFGEALLRRRNAEKAAATLLTNALSALTAAPSGAVTKTPKTRDR
jgi:hypothetical protein